MPPTTFHVPINDASSHVAAPRAVGAPVAVTAGTGALFGSAFPLLLTVTRGVYGTFVTELEATGRTGDTLTVSGPVEGAADAELLVGDLIESRPSALALSEIHAAVHALESAPGTAPGGATGAVQYNDAGSFGGFGSWDGASLGLGAVGAVGSLVARGDATHVALDLRSAPYDGTRVGPVLQYGRSAAETCQILADTADGFEFNPRGDINTVAAGIVQANTFINLAGGASFPPSLATYNLTDGAGLAIFRQDQASDSPYASYLVCRVADSSGIPRDIARFGSIFTDVTAAWKGGYDLLVGDSAVASRRGLQVLATGSGVAAAVGGPAVAGAALSVYVASQVAFAVRGPSSTGTARDLGYIDAGFTVSTDATYTGHVDVDANDHGGRRKGIRVASDGTQALLGFYGSTPVAKAAAPTTLADIITVLRDLGFTS